MKSKEKDMRKMLKKSACVLTAVALSATMVALPAAAEEAHAAEKPYMKTLKLKWDLKKNKAVTSKEAYAGIGAKPLKITVKNYKTTTLKNGKKKTTFTVVFNRTFKPTKKQVHKIVQNAYYGDEGFTGGHGFAIVDIKTGKELGKKSGLAKQLGIKVTSKEKMTNKKTVRDSDGCYFWYYSKVTYKVTVTYPKECKDLALGVWGNNYRWPAEWDSKAVTRLVKAEDEFWDGEGAFGATRYYKKGKTNSHWMRIK